MHALLSSAAQPVALLELDRHGCRWPVASYSTTQMFCNAPVEPFLPGIVGGCYCAAHRARSISPGKAALAGMARAARYGGKG